MITLSCLRLNAKTTSFDKMILEALFVDGSALTANGESDQRYFITRQCNPHPYARMRTAITASEWPAAKNNLAILVFAIGRFRRGC